MIFLTSFSPAREKKSGRKKTLKQRSCLVRRSCEEKENIFFALLREITFRQQKNSKLNYFLPLFPLNTLGNLGARREGKGREEDYRHEIVISLPTDMIFIPTLDCPSVHLSNRFKKSLLLTLPQFCLFSSTVPRPVPLFCHPLHQGHLTVRGLDVGRIHLHHHRGQLFRRSPGALRHHAGVVGAHHLACHSRSDAAAAHTRRGGGHTIVQVQAVLQGGAGEVYLCL